MRLRMNLLLRRIGKFWLAWKYRNYSPDATRAQNVRVAGLVLILRPTVFNPKLHFSSAFLADYLRRNGVVRPGSRVLDLGTGSGLLAISAALSGAGSVTAVDLNPEAVISCRTNASMYGLGGILRAVQGDMFEPVRGERFDLIVCNPPYLRGEASSPGTLAYMAGTNFEWLRRFATSAHDYLAPGGRCLLVLADSTDVRAILRILRDAGWLIRLKARRDLVTERLFIFELRCNGKC